jgi:hypothetical protein
VLDPLASPVHLGERIAASGSLFRGIAEASGGNAGQSSSSDTPLLSILSLASEETRFLLSDLGSDWSDTAFTSRELEDFPLGYALATVFANGIPSRSRIVLVLNPEPEPEGAFHRGDANVSGTIDLSDSVTIFGYLFLGNPAALSCLEAADAGNDGEIDISDGVYLLSWLFSGGPDPAPPGPTTAPCGFDPDPPGSPGDLGCEDYDPCE